MTLKPCCLFSVDTFLDTALSSGIVCALLCFKLLKKYLQCLWKLQIGNKCARSDKGNGKFGSKKVSPVYT
jgi:hypothetical protein